MIAFPDLAGLEVEWWFFHKIGYFVQSTSKAAAASILASGSTVAGRGGSGS